MARTVPRDPGSRRMFAAMEPSATANVIAADGLATPDLQPRRGRGWSVHITSIPVVDRQCVESSRLAVVALASESKGETHGTRIASLAHRCADPDHPPRHVPVSLGKGGGTRSASSQDARFARGGRFVVANVIARYGQGKTRSRAIRHDGCWRWLANEICEASESSEQSSSPPERMTV